MLFSHRGVIRPQHVAAAPCPFPQRPRARRVRCRAASNDGQYGLVLEADGVVMDTHRDGHREAFNRAFSEVGYDCVSWTPAIYDDLMRWGDGTGQGLIKAWFSRMGWPMMMSSRDRPAFVEKVYEAKQRHLKAMVAVGEVPLRKGVTEFIDEALGDGCRIVLLAGTGSAPEDSVLSSAMLNLGPARALKLQTITVGLEDWAAGASAGGEGEGEGGGKALTFEQMVAAAQAEAKKQVAASFVRAMHLKGIGMGLDPTLQAAAERAGLVPPALLVAVMTALGVSVERAAFVGANHSTMESAKTAGMLAAAVPPSLAARGGYTAADVSFDGFGPGGGVTWRKLKAMLQAQQARMAEG